MKRQKRGESSRRQSAMVDWAATQNVAMITTGALKWFKVHCMLDGGDFGADEESVLIQLEHTHTCMPPPMDDISIVLRSVTRACFFSLQCPTKTMMMVRGLAYHISWF